MIGSLAYPIEKDDRCNASCISPWSQLRIISRIASVERILEKLLLESGKYKPVLADNGQEGWKRMAMSPPQALPHALIIDLFMPEMDGFEIVDAMQETEKLKNIPVILITGGDISTTQQEKLDSLNHHLLQKGALNPDELLSTLERSLNHLKDPSLKGKE